ncbi:MAG: hypothetical protein WDZ51_17455 [Pirellulaceae bacterium]
MKVPRGREKGEESNYQNLQRTPQATVRIIGLFPFFSFGVRGSENHRAGSLAGELPFALTTKIPTQW